MLRQDVIEAVERGEFTVYPVKNVDQGIELLTSVPAGARDEQGAFPEGTLNQRVEARLIELAQRQRDFAEGSGEEGSNGPGEEGERSDPGAEHVAKHVTKLAARLRAVGSEQATP
jgi:hypothetical protein